MNEEETELAEEQTRLVSAIFRAIHGSYLKPADIVYPLTVVLTTMIGSRAKHPHEMLNEIAQHLLDYPV